MQETQETWVQLLSLEDPLEEEIVTRSSILAWEIPWTQEPGRLQSMGLQRIRHDLLTKQQLSTVVMLTMTTGRADGMDLKDQ